MGNETVILTMMDAHTRVDPLNGSIEEIAFFGTSPRMFGCVHLPHERARAVAVICSSTHAELLKAYRVEVLLGRELAARGIAVQRFHYRGDGNSEGDISDLTLSTMIDASRQARDHIAVRSETINFVFVGVRLGVYPAAVLSAESPGAPLVLWDPVLDTDRFMSDALRTHAIASIRGEAKPERTEQTLHRLDREGSIDLLGYEITSGFHKSIKGRQLEKYVPGARDALVVPFGSLNTAPLEEAWRDMGITLSEIDGTEREAWWLDVQATKDRTGRARLLASRTADWIAEHVPSGVS